MKKILYQQPHVIVRIISPEELLQIGVNSDPNSGIPGDDSDAKFHDFDEDDQFGTKSNDIWED